MLRVKLILSIIIFRNSEEVCLILYGINLCLLSKWEDVTDASIGKGQFGKWTTDYGDDEFVERKVMNTSYDNSVSMLLPKKRLGGGY